MDLLFFIPLSLSSLRQSHPLTPILSSLSSQSSPLKPQPSLLFHTDTNIDADDYFHVDLSLAMVFLFFFFGCGLMGVLGNGWV